MREFGRLDGAFNNAGGVAATGPVHARSGQDWRADLDQNLAFVTGAALAIDGGSTAQ